MADNSPNLGGLLGSMDSGAIMRAIQARTMRGLDPTPEQAAWLRSQTPRLEENSYRLADMLGPVPAIGEAVQDPSIANVTNAGVKTAGMAGKPLTALGILGAGYGTAGAKDLGLLTMDANAQTAAQSRARAAEAKAKADAEAALLNARTEAERAAAEQRIREAEAATARAAQMKNAELEAQQKAADQAEYNRAVLKAEDTLKSFDGRSVKRFSDTEIGKVYDKLGIVTPFVAAAGMGAVSRAATGGGTMLKDYGLPLAIGAGTGVTAAHWPLGHEILTQPAYNPEKEKYQAYARDLPPTHPRKQEWTDYARNLPEANPARTTAVNEFYDPWKFGERSAIGLIEGLSGGKGGAQAVQAASRMGGKLGASVGNAVEAAAELPGRASKGYQRGMTGAAEAEAGLIGARNRVAEIPPPAVPVAPQAPPMQPPSQGLLDLPPALAKPQPPPLPPPAMPPAQIAPAAPTPTLPPGGLLSAPAPASVAAPRYEPPAPPMQPPSQGLLDLPPPAPKPQALPPAQPAAPSVTTLRPAKGGRFDPSLYGVAPAGGLLAADDENQSAMLALLVRSGLLPPSALQGGR